LNEIDNFTDTFLQEKPVCTDESAIERDILRDYFKEDVDELMFNVADDSPFELLLEDVFDGTAMDNYTLNCSCSSFVSTTENDNEDESILSEHGCRSQISHLAVEQEFEYRPPSEQSFPWKLYDMLQDAESKGFNDVISWSCSGHGFKVHKLQNFVEAVMPLYFDQTKYESFRRQLNLYGFLRVHKGEDQGSYHHEKFVKDDRSRCSLIHRRVQTPTSRKQWI